MTDAETAQLAINTIRRSNGAVTRAASRHGRSGDGEDGPTQQPVEQLASLRAIPGLMALRPGDANEVVEAHRYVMQLRRRAAVLALSRQALPTLDRTKYAAPAGVAQGPMSSPTRRAPPPNSSLSPRAVK
jgi:transketolase